MAKYDECPRCGNSEEGSYIWECKNCQSIICCAPSGFFTQSEICGSQRDDCPECGAEIKVEFLYSSVRTICQIGSDDDEEDEDSDDD